MTSRWDVSANRRYIVDASPQKKNHPNLVAFRHAAAGSYGETDEFQGDG